MQVAAAPSSTQMAASSGLSGGGTIPGCGHLERRWCPAHLDSA
jgi:hypothetical protein